MNNFEKLSNDWKDSMWSQDRDVAKVWAENEFPDTPEWGRWMNGKEKRRRTKRSVVSVVILLIAVGVSVVGMLFADVLPEPLTPILMLVISPIGIVWAWERLKG